MNVKYVKSENNISDICTKNLLAKLFEKHSEKLVSDVGLFTRCNTRLMGKVETYQDTDWAKEERLRELAEPMGEFPKKIRYEYTITEWIPDYGRLK